MDFESHGHGIQRSVIGVLRNWSQIIKFILYSPNTPGHRPYLPLGSNDNCDRLIFSNLFYNSYADVFYPLFDIGMISLNFLAYHWG